MSSSTERQIIFLSPEPEGRVIWFQIPRSRSRLWFRHDDGWLREEWCGKFPDGTPRPPWDDDKFLRIWETEGPEAAQDKSRYDLSEQEQIIAEQG